MSNRTIVLIFLVLLLSVLVSCMAQPASAQSPTVTPLPGPAATATVAAQSMTRAQQQQAQADQMRAAANQQRAEAAQLDATAQTTSANATAAYEQAQADAAAAREALTAQQYQAAGEAIGHAEAGIASGRDQIAAIGSTVTQLRGVVESQASTIISLTNELQQAQSDKQTTLNAYNTVIAQQEISQRNNTIGSLFSGLLFVAVMFALILWGAQVMRRRHDASPQVVEHDDIVDGEVIDDPQ